MNYGIHISDVTSVYTMNEALVDSQGEHFLPIFRFVFTCAKTAKTKAVFPFSAL